jgi:hypothetical protein
MRRLADVQPFFWGIMKQELHVTPSEACMRWRAAIAKRTASPQ